MLRSSYPTAKEIPLGAMIREAVQLPPGKVTQNSTEKVKENTTDFTIKRHLKMILSKNFAN